MARRIGGLPLHGWIAGACALCVVLGVQYFSRRAFAEYERRVAVVQGEVDSLVSVADSLANHSSALEHEADSLAAEVDRRSASVRERIVYVRDSLPPAPEPCDQYIEPRDEAIDSLSAIAHDVQLALDRQKEASAVLRAAYENSRTAVDSLSDVLDARPRLPPLWIPKVSGGVFVGVCTNGQPCAGVGVGLTWEVPISEIL